jgi:hypothetical protein
MADRGVNFERKTMPENKSELSPNQSKAFCEALQEFARLLHGHAQNLGNAAVEQEYPDMPSTGQVNGS